MQCTTYLILYLLFLTKLWSLSVSRVDLKLQACKYITVITYKLSSEDSVTLSMKLLVSLQVLIGITLIIIIWNKEDASVYNLYLVDYIMEVFFISSLKEDTNNSETECAEYTIQWSFRQPLTLVLYS